jgi:hypothetical protein
LIDVVDDIDCDGDDAFGVIHPIICASHYQTSHKRNKGDSVRTISQLFIEVPNPSATHAVPPIWNIISIVSSLSSNCQNMAKSPTYNTHATHSALTNGVITMIIITGEV